jgi:hypothetical protein
MVGVGERAVEVSRFMLNDAPEITPLLRVQWALEMLGKVGVALLIVAPEAFVICALFYRDIAAAFHGDPNERSNQAIQRTAPRSDA